MPNHLTTFPSALLSLGLCAWAPGAAAQRPPAPPVERSVAVDPYTEADAGRMGRLGYVAFAPIALTNWYGSEDVDDLVGPGRMLWVETDHFRIGVPNVPYRISSERKQRDKIRSELVDLQAVLPTIDPKVDMLDPWLRLHLFAARCERVYADVQEFLGVSDLDFPQKASHVRPGAAFMGLGPYLGTKDKFAVLILPSGMDLGRYTAKYTDRRYECPKRYNHGWGKGLTFATAPDLKGGLHDDTVMHCHVVYSVVHNLLDGYRNWCHDTPVWFKSGFAQMALRRVDPRFPNFDIPQDGKDIRRAQRRAAADWHEIARNLAVHNRAISTAELVSRRDYERFRHHDFIIAWSRVSFLVGRHGEAACRQFWHRMKDPFGVPQEQLDWTQVLERQEAALLEAFGYESLEDLDAAWRKFAAGAK